MVAGPEHISYICITCESRSRVLQRALLTQLERNSLSPLCMHPVGYALSSPDQRDRYIEYPGASRRRWVVERQDAISLGKLPLKRPGQLSIWQLTTPRSDAYEKDAKLCVDTPPGFRFAIRQESTEALRKTCEKTTIFTYFAERFDEFPLYRKSETGRCIYA